MEERDVIQVLRYQRHDLMNQLQLIQGYLSMGKSEKVQEKITAYTTRLNEERKLMNLNTPLFALWLIQFNDVHTNFRLTYDIHIENKNMAAVDKQLVEQCTRVFERLQKTIDETELYEGELLLDESMSPSIITLKIMLNGLFPSAEKLNIENVEQDFASHVEETTTGLMYQISIPYPK